MRTHLMLGLVAGLLSMPSFAIGDDDEGGGSGGDTSDDTGSGDDDTNTNTNTNDVADEDGTGEGSGDINDAAENDQNNTEESGDNDPHND